MLPQFPKLVKLSIEEHWIWVHQVIWCDHSTMQISDAGNGESLDLLVRSLQKAANTQSW
jgi:hypothetical protein